mgnify:CR=1 FL=1
MKRLIPILLLVLTASCTSRSDIHVWGYTPDSDSCYAQGVSAAFCGVIDGHLIMAGGANFPESPAAQGGAKRYYNAVYASSVKGKNLHWERVGVLPHPMAYGVAVSDEQGMVFVGGCNTEGGLCGAFRLRRTGNILRYEPYASLPFTLDNMAGALMDNKLYVVGGLKDGVSSNGMYMLNLKANEWFECAPIPGAPRVQPVCAAQGGKLYVWGGYDQPVDSLGRVVADGCMVHSDGWQYDPKEDKWSPLPTPSNAEGHPMTLTGGAALPWGKEEVLAVGGVNRNVFLGGIQGIFPMPDYLEHEAEWYKFNPCLMAYNVNTGIWRVVDQSELLARAGESLVTVPIADPKNGETEDAVLVIGGEIKPGIRSTNVTCIPSSVIR